LRSPKTDWFWGDYQTCIIGTTNNDHIRENASSGGFISTIAIYLLKTNQIDGVIHIGASTEKPYQNIVKVSKSKDEILRNANSRYSPAAPLIDILNILKSRKKYAFIGKPCDVSALRQLSTINEKVAKQIVCYLSFFCAGTSSIKSTFQLVTRLGLEVKDILKLDYRKDGWPGNFKVVDKEGQTHTISYNDSWGKVLNKKLQLRCKICGDGFGELSDITCGDAWNSFDSRGYPNFSNQQGQNIIFSKTKMGDVLLNELLRTQKIRLIERIENLRKIDKVQPGQLNRKRFLKARLFAFRLSFISYPQYDPYLYLEPNSITGCYQNFWQFIGTLKRIILRQK